ncbi:MAG: tRNA (cytidine(34)-2'-O)-methyltransferase [Gemmataceae bacterium]|nr:tRNA (cytidine(34)-2'-O)-methyltransferase [Gemmataceae bacterium]
MFRVALHEPEIAANAGAIGRLCLAAGCSLEIVGQPGFRLDDRSARRAGLDYWPLVPLARRDSLAELEASAPRLWVFTTRGTLLHTAPRYGAGDVLVFGSESKGLPDTFLARHPERLVRVPILGEAVRSLNLAQAVAIAVYEGLRQNLGWGLKDEAPPADD